MKPLGWLSVMLVTAIGLCLGTTGDSAASSREEPEGGAVLAWVNGEAITAGDLKSTLAHMRRPQGTAAEESFASESILRRLIQNRLLEQEGYRTGADQTQEVKTQVRNLVQQKSLLALMDSVSAEVPEVDAKELDSFLDQSNEILRLSHILVADRETARALLDSLTAGATFSGLADRQSIDTTWAKKGGDLGWAAAGNFIPEFEAVLQDIELGEVAGPVESAEGWHLLQLTDSRTETAGQSSEMRDAMREAEMEARVMERMQAYVRSLKEKYGVVVDEELLASLDYGSDDPKVQEELKSSDAVLCTVGDRELTVARLTFQIRFQKFHGTEGREDANAVRDQIFDDWLTETVLRYEAIVQGYPNRPEILAQAKSLERQLVREAVLGIIFNPSFEPTNDEIADYYADHLEDFFTGAMVRLSGVLIADKAEADQFRKSVDEGAGLSWLAERSPAVQDPDPAAFSDWLDPSTLDSWPEEAKKGTVVGPFLFDGSWAVVQVADVRPPQPTPLDQCAKQVAQRVRGERMREALKEALGQLESQAEVQVEDGAGELIEDEVASWLAGSTTSGNS